jgi:SAM-dependent methyltransferase
MPTTQPTSWLGAPDAAWRRHLRRLRRPAWLAPFRLAPVSAHWGFDRGTPVDRYYIERFVAAHRGDIRGRVVEMYDSGYTDRFGTGVTRRDVLDLDQGNPHATIVTDLAAADSVADDTFDCFILTQTLQFILDVPAALRHVHRMLRPGGVALVTVPAVSRLAPGYGLERDYWRFTPASCAALFASAFGSGAAEVRGQGNVRTAIAFLAGLAREELPRAALEAQDDFFPVIVTVRAVKTRR